MANNVYIGSRYVPIFDGTWSNSKSYEPLTIVEYGTSSYTSKRQVPAGTLPTNTTYWALTGNYNGQISSLQQRMTAAENDIDNLLGDMTTAKSDITSLKTRTTNLEKRVTLLDTKHFMFIGDSYGDGSDEWVNQVVTMLGIPSSRYEKLCTGGHGFTGKSGATGGTTGPTLEWLTDLTNWVNNHTTAQREAITDVYIIGGFNDWYCKNVNTIRNYMSAFFTYAKTNLPNAKFYVGMCGWCSGHVENITTPNQTESSQVIRFQLAKTVEIAYSYAPTYGATFIPNLYATIHGYSTDYDDSGYHPNSAGLEKLSRAIANIILNGSYTFIGGRTAFGFTDSSTSSSFNPGYSYIVDNEVFFKPLASAQYSWTPAASHYALDLITTNLKVSNGAISGGKSASADFTTMPIIAHDATNHKVISGYAYIDGITCKIVLFDNVTANTTYIIKFLECQLPLSQC